MTTLKLAQAKLIIDAALAEGRRQNLAPLAVAVLDAGGHLVAYQREGAVGISGDVGDKDEACALAGIASAGLNAAPGLQGG